jgi:hypothetical protein
MPKWYTKISVESRHEEKINLLRPVSKMITKT